MSSIAAMDIGHDAPNFTLQDQEGFSQSLTNQTGKFVILVFIKNAASYKACVNLQKIENFLSDVYHEKVTVFAVTDRDMESNCKLYDKSEVSFDILSDQSKEMISLYNGVGYFGVKDKVVVVGPDGRVLRNYTNFNKFLSSKSIINFIINYGN